MKNIILGISFLIIILLGFVIKDTVLDIDLVETKNRFLQNEYLSEVQKIKNTDLLYLEVKKQIKFRENDRKEQSIKSINDTKLLGVSIFLTILNIILILSEQKKKNIKLNSKNLIIEENKQITNIQND